MDLLKKFKISQKTQESFYFFSLIFTLFWTLFFITIGVVSLSLTTQLLLIGTAVINLCLFLYLKQNKTIHPSYSRVNIWSILILLISFFWLGIFDFFSPQICKEVSYLTIWLCLWPINMAKNTIQCLFHNTEDKIESERNYYYKKLFFL